MQKVLRKQDKQLYALKIVNIKKLQPREREDAVNEIRVLASIKHRNIVRYCDAFVEKDSLYIAMEFAEHGDIGRQIEKFKKANKYIKEDTVSARDTRIRRPRRRLRACGPAHAASPLLLLPHAPSRARAPLPRARRSGPT